MTGGGLSTLAVTTAPRYFVDQGLDVYVGSGITNRASLAKKLRPQIVSSILSLQLKSKKYGPMRVIHGSGVLFHLEELHSAFRGTKYLLEDRGVLVAEFVTCRHDGKLCL